MQKGAAVVVAGEAAVVEGGAWAAFVAGPWGSSCPWVASAWGLLAPSCPPATGCASWDSSGRASMANSYHGEAGPPPPEACPAAEASSWEVAGGGGGGEMACRQKGSTPQLCLHSPTLGAASCP